MRILGPVLGHAHEQFQEDSGSDEPLDVEPGLCADLFEHGALLSDHDCLLARPFDVDDGVDIGGVTLFELLDLDRHGIGNFLLGQVEHLFTDDLGRQKAFTQVGELVFGKEART
jgi:hypothetical protein